MKKYLQDLAFFFAIFFLIIGKKLEAIGYRDEVYWAYPYAGAVVVLFFLWKNNYFIRNK